MMQRIIATLFALADLLDRAVYAPRPIRWCIFRLLLPVEPIIRRFAMRTGWEAGAIAFILPDQLPPKCRASRAAASHLADCYYALAIALQRLPKQLYERWLTCEALQRAVRELLNRLARLCALHAAPPAHPTPLIDTS